MPEYTEDTYAQIEAAAMERIRRPDLFSSENVYETIGRMMVWLYAHKHLSKRRKERVDS